MDAPALTCPRLHLSLRSSSHNTLSVGTQVGGEEDDSLGVKNGPFRQGLNVPEHHTSRLIARGQRFAVRAEAKRSRKHLGKVENRHLLAAGGVPHSCAAVEAAAALPREEPQYLVRGRDPEHQPVGRNVSRPAATAGECAGGADL